ncbi:hypothetical protein EDB85DRAFT_2074698 [Lactarius pseudohatsudake]|nr:hypothetical protein EDB85DRAFT_2074698 [Lactarius pseudohatsudake]
MANTPDANTTQLPTDLSYPHQLLEESDRDNHVPFPTAPDTPAEAEELNQSLPASSSSGSQLTSSDKLSALPSHLRPSPTGRSATSLRMKSGTLVGSELPSTSETRLPSPPALHAAQPMHHSVSDSAVERETSRQRVSFDSDRGSSTSPRPNHRQLPTASEPILPGSHGSAFASLLARAHDSVHGHRLHDSPQRQGHGHSRKASQSQKNSAESPTQSRSRSPSPSRAISPLRTFLDRFSPLGRVYSREEPFMPIDPFQFHFSLSLHLFARCFGAQEGTPASQTDVSCTCPCVPFFGSARFHSVHIVAFDMLPRQMYLHTQLRLPSLYFSRVARIFQDAAVSRPELQRIIDACEAAGSETTPFRTTGTLLPFPEDWVPPNVSPALARFKLSWETFVASLVREWKTLNVLSALLPFIQDAADDPLTRTAALCSLVSALMSLSFGIMYIVRFDNMRSMYRASRWAEEAQKTETAIFWNVWVLLALPGVWLAWSVLAFVVAIMSFVWRTGAQGQSQSPLSPHAELGPRIGITCQVGLGLVYFILVIRTFRNYGEVELETRPEWARDRERDEARQQARARARADEEDTREGERGRSRASDGAEPKVNPPRNELGLSGIDRRKQEATGGDGGDPMNDSYSSLGM